MKNFAQHDEYDDHREGVAEKHLLHQRQIARKADEKVHARKAQRRPENIEDSDSFFNDAFSHTQHYMPAK